MKKSTLIAFILALSQPLLSPAQPVYKARIEPCPCLVKMDSSARADCGYLIVPENRKKPNGRSIKLPFIRVLSSNPDKRPDPVFFTTGGPGYASLQSVEGIKASSSRLVNRDFIVMDQRGTGQAIPCLKCTETDEAIRQAYRNNLSKDSMVLKAVAKCRDKFTAQGIDLSAYNTIESAADIEDLRKTLGIDSMNLIGISYSGGLMLTVLRNFPNGVRSLVLNSPLPGYVNYEEDGLLNFNEALDNIFRNCETDSAHLPAYANMKERFRNYLSSIGGRQFILEYTEKGTNKAIPIRYTRNELISVLENYLGSHNSIKDVPAVMNELMKGNHTSYVRDVLNNIFDGNSRGFLGMRYSVYCTEQILYAKESLVKRQDELLPWLAGYPFNNVNHAICKCWKVKPEDAVAKSPVYSNKPALLGAGDVDPWTRPFYNDLIHRYMPNSQRVLVINRTHLPPLGTADSDFTRQFLDNPYIKLKSSDQKVIVY